MPARKMALVTTNPACTLVTNKWWPPVARVTSYCPAIQLLKSVVSTWLVFWNWTSTVIHIGWETKENLAHEINSRVLVIKNGLYFDPSSLIKVTIRYKEHTLSNSPMLVKNDSNIHFCVLISVHYFNVTVRTWI